MTLVVAGASLINRVVLRSECLDDAKTEALVVATKFLRSVNEDFSGFNSGHNQAETNLTDTT